MSCNCTDRGRAGRLLVCLPDRQDQLELDDFWMDKLPPSRKGTRWLNVLKTLVCYRLIDPGSEWRLHRHWYDQSAMADLLGEDFSLVQVDKLYRCLDKLLAHKKALFVFLTQRWQVLFDARFDVLLYDLTSTYFECEPSASEIKRFGYSRDKRPDCRKACNCIDCYPARFSVGLRGNARKHQRQNDLIGIS